MKMDLMKKKKKKGFTLIELIVVVAIIGILAAIAIPNFSTIRQDTKKKADKATAKTIGSLVMSKIADETLKADVGTLAIPAVLNADKTEKTPAKAAANLGILPVEVSNAMQGNKSPQSIKGGSFYVVYDVDDGIVQVFAGEDSTKAIANKLYPEEE